MSQCFHQDSQEAVISDHEERLINSIQMNEEQRVDANSKYQ